MKFNRRKYIGFLGGLSLMGFSGLTETGRADQTAVNTPNGGRYKTNILICGGGPAGFAAAVMAARLGCKTLLLERYGRLGGMGVHARVFPFLGRAASPFVEEVHKKTGGTAFDPERLDLIYADMIQEAGGRILLHSFVYEPKMSGSRITGVKIATKEGSLDIQADLVIDATGDGDIAAMAGAPFEIGRKEDGLVQPMSIMYTVAGLGPNAEFSGSEQDARKRMIGNRSWEQIVTEAQNSGELPENVGVVRTYRMKRSGEAAVNATQINRVLGTSVEDLTNAELEGRRQAYRILDFMKKHLPGYENAFISNMPAVIGVRETRRIGGLARLEKEDLITGRSWPDEVVRKASFCIDIHNPAGGGQAKNRGAQSVQGTAERDKPYGIPLGCLIPQKIDGLLVAGRCISGSHEAHSSYRVQNICMAIGAAAGTVAALACKAKISPDEIKVKEAQRILFWNKLN